MDLDESWGEKLSNKAQAGDKSKSLAFVVEITSKGVSIHGQGSGEAGSTLRDLVVTIEHLSSTLLTSTKSSQKNTTIGTFEN
jgi:hypothetical protein